MRRILGVLCIVIGHRVPEWVPFVRGSQLGEYGLCHRCERLDVREVLVHAAPARRS